MPRLSDGLGQGWWTFEEQNKVLEFCIIINYFIIMINALL
jgi:hypothetical protein